MKVSIITVNLNNSHGLEKTIKSVIKQTFKDYEYIIIDGLSTDNSIKIIKQYSYKISYWVSEPDKGIYNAINKAIIKANGDYCLFINSGDSLINNDILNKIANYLNDIDIIYGNIIVFNKNSNYLIKYPDKLTFSDFFNKSIPHSGGSFIKRDLFAKYGLYNENYKIVSDWEFFIKVIILNNATYKHIDEVFSYFHLDGISTQQMKLMDHERKQVLESLIPKRMLADYYKYFTEKETSSLEKISMQISKYKLSMFLLKALYYCVIIYKNIFNKNGN
jgi:glycosyltransferase involved in cell wall biosynthesis